MSLDERENALAELIIDMEYNDGEYLLTNGEPASLDVYPDQQRHVLMDVITESNLAASFFTEKTFKAIANGMPFVIFGMVNANQMLTEKFGFKLYPEMISYDFDSEPDLNKRAEMLCEQLQQLSHKDHNALWEQSRDTARFNIERFFELYESMELMPDVIKNMVLNTIPYDDVGTGIRFEIYRDCVKNVDNLKQVLLDNLEGNKDV